AVYYYQLAVNKGHAKAQCSLAFCYEHGLGVTQNITIVSEYYGSSAKAGDAKAKLISEWARQSKIIDAAQIKYMIGLSFKNGIGIDKDLNMAAKYYVLAANQGHVRARFNLGYFHEHGLARKTDLKKAV